MADEPDDIEPDLLRERLLMLAEHGEITGKQAEAAAAAHGLEPFERKPELPDFDPKLKSHWTIMMVVAWIAWRDFELVRKQDPEFCSACFHWVGRLRKVRPQNDGDPVTRMVYSLEARRAPTVGRLALQDELLRGRTNVSSRAVMRIREAVAALWHALSENHLVAQGFDAHGAVVEIPSRQWAYLRLREEKGRDVLRYDAVSRPEPFTEVTLRQSDALRLWPVTRESPILSATVVDKGGRPPEYDWAAIKEIALQLMKKFGKPQRDNKRLPSKAQLIELIQEECAARFDRQPPISSLRSHLKQWLAE
ncbi:hypothetical protein [Bradyrhizobium valentinum]|uniref:Uncharacterized protein n=1 Tax=Bradyrhizobium valentinum TaxID=1518501 RepID=A0A0R3KML2_9BRAD|nr:hypothetical protein [Bradyrhizobium valentinum]KRQ94452.1 hypothetical protein CQ10_33990 [Bradyrhizobium valentinum]KRR10567.1 hypothetical protein CP49_12360 [Bradyrhizobium valentinum]